MAGPDLDVGVNLNLAGNQLLNARVQALSAAPAHSAGRIYFDTALGQLGVSNGTAWTYLKLVTTDTKAVQDIAGAMFSSSTVVTATYDSANGKIALTIGNAQIVNAMVSGTAAISADKTADGTNNKVFLAAEKTKLSGIATGATANATDAALRARGSHTGTQTADTISDLTTFVDGRISNVVGGAPAVLDTLVELAAAINNDANFATTVFTQLSTKAGKFTAVVGDGTATSFVITHNLNTFDVGVFARGAASPRSKLVINDEATTVNSVTVYFGQAPAANSVRVTVVG